MRLILSRKGFDSQYGGVPSPIFPDGTIISLPIPSAHETQCLGELRYSGFDVGALAAQLTGNRINQETRVHLDPDLNGSALERAPGWRPAFGQVASAQSHLAKQNVGEGDIFLFFGWFRRVERSGQAWRYVSGSPDIHAIFGWLQVGEVLSIGRQTERILGVYPWLRTHPHIARATQFESSNNTIYVGSENLVLGGKRTPIPGGGVFEKFSPMLRLTADGRTRSVWSLPPWFSPVGKPSGLTYHTKLSRWTRDGDSVELQSVAKGQEFVLDCEHYPESEDWIAALFADRVPTDIKESP
jgi:hypothetical protein